MSQYYPPYRSSRNNIKVELDVAKYATKTDLNNITHVDVSSFASKTNLAALKTEIDKIDADKLKTTPADLAKLTYAVEHDVVKKTDYNTKVTSIEAQIAGLTKNTVDNLADITKLKAIDTNSFVNKTKFYTNKISKWKSTGIFNRSSNSKYRASSNMNSVGDSSGNLPNLKNDGRMNVYLSGNHFQQNVAGIPNNDNVINIYCVYKLDPIASTRDTSFTIQDALFGAMQITKNATDNSKNNYKGYGICFDERSQFGHTMIEGGRTHIKNGRNVLIFGADMSFSIHRTNRANHIYVMGDGFTQGIHDTTLYVEKKYYRNFTEPDVKFVLSLHYNGDDSYLFVNGRQELKFKCKTNQLVREKLCIGNLSDQWTTSESEKKRLHGNIYDFVIDYEQILGVNSIYDMHRCLMTKRNISL